MQESYGREAHEILNRDHVCERRVSGVNRVCYGCAVGELCILDSDSYLYLGEYSS